MKTHLFVLLPPSTAPLELHDAFERLLKPHHLDPATDEIQPNWKYDYLCEFDPTLNCALTELELPYEILDLHWGHISRVSRLHPDSSCGALLTTDGVWHDIWDFGWKTDGDTASNAIAERKWNAHVSRLLLENPECWVLETWAHS